MKGKIIGVLLVVVFLFGSAGFTQGVDNDAGAYIAVLSINQIPLTELSRKITLHREILNGGNIILEGKIGSKHRIDEVLVSIDGKESWQQATSGSGGRFSFSFRTELMKDYYIYIGVKDTAGRLYQLQQTGYQATVMDKPLITAVRQTLDGMLEAYRGKNAYQFMRYVHPGFVGDDILLHRAISRDFSRLDVTSLRYSMDNWAVGTQGRVAVTVRFQRSAVSLRHGNMLRDEGITQMVFAPGADGPLLYSMKAPLLFGLSDAGNLSSGIIVTGNNASGSFIVVDQSGAAVMGTLAETGGV